jgi:hypothetical protein
MGKDEVVGAWSWQPSPTTTRSQTKTTYINTEEETAGDVQSQLLIASLKCPQKLGATSWLLAHSDLKIHMSTSDGSDDVTCRND